ncbi:MAG TPA: hypothetical protein VKC59_02080, partial [Candidatus Limnocylindrales bacterium]|nr:hypothetical protein [Candidatus Limnocylindrales bacterium]
VDVVATVGLGPGLATLGVGPLEIRAGDRTWVAGTGEKVAATEDLFNEVLLGADPPAPTVPPVGTLDVDRFELFRAMTGRRSERQIRAYDWSVDPAPYLPVFSFGPFTMSPTDIGE